MAPRNSKAFLRRQTQQVFEYHVLILLTTQSTHSLIYTVGMHAILTHTHTHAQSGSQLFLSSESDCDRQQPDSSSAPLRKRGTEELSTSFSTAGVTEETETRSHTGQR